MKMHISKCLSLGLSLTLALTLTACGGDTKSGGSSPSNNNSATEQAGTTLSELLGSGESIWYLTDSSVGGTGKDTEVETLLLLEADGTVYAGNADGMTLGDFAKMEEGDIAQMARDAYAKAARAGILLEFDDAPDMQRMNMLNEELFELTLQECAYNTETTAYVLSQYTLPEALNEPLQRYLDAFSSFSGDRDVLSDVMEAICSYDPDSVDDILENNPESADAITALLEQLYAIQDEIANDLYGGAQPGRWALSLNTDQTGNHPESVTFAWSTERLDGAMISSVTCYASQGEGQTVYDVLYGGVDVKGGALVTRVDGPYNIVLENIDSGLPLDVEPEALFS